VTLKSRLRVTQCEWKMTPFERLGVVFLFTFCSNYESMAVSLKNGLGLVQGHCRWRGSIDHVRLRIGQAL